ncbi:MAG: leucyl aminopeptidase [Pseudomonadota bacterium]|nr:leucyl aminopeptidase [Pseudomonadota bacterium]
MTAPIDIEFTAAEDADLTAATGVVVALCAGPDALGAGAEAADAAMSGGLARAVAGTEWKGKAGDVLRIPAPAGMAADLLLLVSLGDAGDAASARKAGGALAAALAGKTGRKPSTVFAAGLSPETVAEIAFGLALRAYGFDVYKTGADDKVEPAPVTFAVDAPEKVGRASRANMAVAEGVFFARDLVNEPANVLGTEEFAARLAAMGELGLEVEILEEADLKSLGMGALLGVGLGSETPTKVVVMQWRGGGDEPPLALVGKGVVFDTGGISLKPAGGMEEMTMDMGGAGLVAGVMRALALRGAKANVVGLVGLVENMPDGRAQRPGDIVKSMKGDTIEVINTDAEGRLVLADVLWYAQDRFKPSAMMNFATLTGAIIVALGHETAGYFSNSDAFSAEFAAAAEATAEAAWRMPMGPGYDKLLKSRLADMKNVGGGRAGGSIVAAQFLKRFVKDETPWIHVDIAGVALRSEALDLSPRGATGWGVRAVDALVRGREKA